MGGDSFLRAAANTRIHDVPFHDVSEEGTGKDFCKQKGAALPFRVSGSTELSFRARSDPICEINSPNVRNLKKKIMSDESHPPEKKSSGFITATSNKNYMKRETTPNQWFEMFLRIGDESKPIRTIYWGINIH